MSGRVGQWMSSSAASTMWMLRLVGFELVTTIPGLKIVVAGRSGNGLFFRYLAKSLSSVSSSVSEVLL